MSCLNSAIKPNTKTGLKNKMTDAFNQTDNLTNVDCDLVSDLLNRVDLDKIMKQAEHFNKMMDMEKMMGVGRGTTTGVVGSRCGIGGARFAILPIIASYFMMNGLMLLVVCCILAYVVYLKTNNTCCNEECNFNLNKHMVSQMKLDVIVFIKKMFLLALNKSVCIVKFISKISNVCHHVYSKGVEELIKELGVEDKE